MKVIFLSPVNSTLCFKTIYRIGSSAKQYIHLIGSAPETSIVYTFLKVKFSKKTVIIVPEVSPILKIHMSLPILEWRSYFHQELHQNWIFSSKGLPNSNIYPSLINEVLRLGNFIVRLEFLSICYKLWVGFRFYFDWFSFLRFLPWEEHRRLCRSCLRLQHEYCRMSTQQSLCNVFTKTNVVKVYLVLCTSTPFCSVEIFIRYLRLRKHLADEGLMEYVCVVAAVHFR